MGRTIYTKKQFKIYRIAPNGFIVHNTSKVFKVGHTHINNYNTAKYIINLACNKSIPKKRLSNYLLESLIRISTDEKYKLCIQRLMR